MKTRENFAVFAPERGGISSGSEFVRGEVASKKTVRRDPSSGGLLMNATSMAKIGGKMAVPRAWRADFCRLRAPRASKVAPSRLLQHEKTDCEKIPPPRDPVLGEIES